MDFERITAHGIFDHLIWQIDPIEYDWVNVRCLVNFSVIVTIDHAYTKTTKTFITCSAELNQNEAQFPPR